MSNKWRGSGTSLSQVAEERGYKIIRAVPHPRHLFDIDPTITFVSHSITNARSYFTVYSEDRLIFSESTTLEPVDSTALEVDGILYKTSLVPGLWEHISKSSDASQYTIIQRVIQDSESSSPTYSTSPPIFSATYKFLYHPSSLTEQNFSVLPTEPLVETSDFSLETLVSIESDAYPEVIDFAKSPNIFDLNFTLGQDGLSPPTEFLSPLYYPQLISDVILDEDEQLLSSASSFDGIDNSNYPWLVSVNVSAACILTYKVPYHRDVNFILCITALHFKLLGGVVIVSCTCRTSTK